MAWACAPREVIATARGRPVLHPLDCIAVSEGFVVAETKIGYEIFNSNAYKHYVLTALLIEALYVQSFHWPNFLATVEVVGYRAAKSVDAQRRVHQLASLQNKVISVI